MIKKTQLTIFAAMVLSCSMSYGQVFNTISPSELGLNGGDTFTGQQAFDIGTQFGLANSAVQLLVDNATVTADGELFTVGQNSGPTRFEIVSAVPFDGFIQHGGVLGSQSFASGSGVSDGFTSLDGADFTIDPATLSSEFEFNVTPNANGTITYDVTHIGEDDGLVADNGAPFRFVSTEPITAFNVFSNNTLESVNNFSVGFRTAAAIPEPSSTALFAMASTLLFVRRRRS